MCWLVTAGLQLYVADTGTHGAIVGAYLPGTLLAVAAIPFWTFFAPALIDAAAALGAGALSSAMIRALDWLNAIGLVTYAGASIAVLFYVAFTNYGA